MSRRLCLGPRGYLLGVRLAEKFILTLTGQLLARLMLEFTF